MGKRYIYGGKEYTLNSLKQEFRKRDLAITDYYNNLEGGGLLSKLKFKKHESQEKKINLITTTEDATFLLNKINENKDFVELINNKKKKVKN